jgi:hypothetical protein
MVELIRPTDPIRRFSSTLYGMPPALTAIILIFAGEALSIGAELVASRQFAIHRGSFVPTFIGMFLVIAFAGALLIAGYIIGYQHLKNIWIVATISVTSILIVEPILAFLLFQQFPTTGAGVGFLLGVLGTLAALFF